ncbi:hypothetical protein BT69DRAFT_797945 [Atractiella rhizophila]|nr:hypothetical protein BT69DRAFT_797945 [Atractiella rhizophila]
MADDDGDFFGDVVEFGDGTLYQVSQQVEGGESNLLPESDQVKTGVEGSPAQPSSLPVPSDDAKLEEPKDEFDRTWPSRNKETKSLFNERLGKFEPWTGGVPAPTLKKEDWVKKDTSQKPKSLGPASSASSSSRPDIAEQAPAPRPWATNRESSAVSPPARESRLSFSRDATGRDPPPHRGFSREMSRRDSRDGASAASSRDRSNFARDNNGPSMHRNFARGGPPDVKVGESSVANDRPLPPHLSQRVRVDSVEKIHPLQQQASPTTTTSPMSRHSSIQTATADNGIANPVNGVHQLEPVLSQPVPLLAEENLEELHQKSMLSAAERARKRRREEEETRQAEKERAMAKARELEERLKPQVTTEEHPSQAESVSAPATDRPWRSLEKVAETPKPPITILKPKEPLLKRAVDNSAIVEAEKDKENERPSSWRRQPESAPLHVVASSTPTPAAVSPLVSLDGKETDNNGPTRPKLQKVASLSAKPAFKPPELSSLDLVMSRIKNVVDADKAEKAARPSAPIAATQDDRTTRSIPATPGEHRRSVSGQFDSLPTMPSNVSASAAPKTFLVKDHQGKFRPRSETPVVSELPVVRLPPPPFEITSRSSRPSSPPPPWKAYVVHLNARKTRRPPIPYGQTRGFLSRHQPSAVHSQTWFAGKQNVGRYHLKEEWLFSHRKFVKGVPQTVIKLPKLEASRTIGIHPFPAESTRGKGRGEYTAPGSGRGRAMEMTSWRRAEPLASKVVERVDVKETQETELTEVTTAPPSHTLFEESSSKLREQKEKVAKSKLRDGMNVAFYRDSSVTGEPKEEKSNMFMVTSELNGSIRVEVEIEDDKDAAGEIKVAEVVEPAPVIKESSTTADTSSVSRSVTPPPAPISSKMPSSAPPKIPLPMKPSESTSTSSLEKTTSISSINSTWNRNMSSNKIKDVWSQPENESHENSLRGIADEYPSAPFPSSVDQLKSDDGVEESDANKDTRLDPAFSLTADLMPLYGPPPSSFTYTPGVQPPPPPAPHHQADVFNTHQSQQPFNRSIGHGSHGPIAAPYHSHSAHGIGSSNMLNSYSNSSSTAIARS